MDHTAVLTLIGTATGLIKTVADLTTESKVREKTVELNSVIIGIQSGLITMQKESFELQQENERLKNEIASFNNWETIKSYYVLMRTSDGNIVYTPSERHPQPKPERYICANCFNDHRESIYVKVPPYGGAMHQCPKCKTVIMIRV